MATTSYTWSSNNSVLTIDNPAIPANVMSPAIAANAAGTRYLAAWTSGTGDTGIAGRLIGAPATPVTGEFSVTALVAPLPQFDARVAALADGRFVVTYTDTQNDPGGDVRARASSTPTAPAPPGSIL